MNAFRELSGLPTPVMKNRELAAVVEKSIQDLNLGGFCALETADNSPMVFTDPVLLELILVNLIQNAREAGAASLRVRVDQGRIELSDTGPGLPEPLRTAIMAGTLQPGYTSKPGSKGMGLFIVSELCAALGIGLAVESGQAGTCFRLEFDHG
jgi:signal transduction histidine kinase